mmetsp:Transcript_31402/g.34284  ORF Transcript_31402/g.34284 Transcript_31402/m.34284 type:complete len:156 (+) Transcript_31402:111-578(+)|eukprot:CAMPEP_0173151342 /NCGR_PEP_ID=MMETSP1105-20130129/11513_1 /TAXON_ID=2985 /ORGANISM="Ochromonas sp., Strain BG-1" /LENGTH=155 /DNA_ID=CAMNT_0014066679 /DNA_START=83 /DNA_END=550 /DNA_ORIENTATION=-
MDKSFQSAVAAYKVAAQLTHRQEVMRLYRSSLRLIASWSESREVFNSEALKVRAEFDENKNLPADSAKVKRLLREAHERLARQAHPDPYIAPFMPGGSLFMRNPALPLEAIYPDGIPEGVSRRRVNIDFSNIPDDQPYANRVFVDSANKKYYIDQ